MQSKEQRDTDHHHPNLCNHTRDLGGCLVLSQAEEQAEMFIFGRQTSPSPPSSTTPATPSTQFLTCVSSITNSSSAELQRSISVLSGTKHSQRRRKEHPGSSQSQSGTSGTSSRSRTIQEGRNIPAKEVISIYEEGNEFEGEHLSFPGQGAWRGPPSSHPTSPSRTPSPSSSSSSSTASQSGRDFRGSGDSGAIVVMNVLNCNSTLCATDTLACHSTITGGKTTSASLKVMNQLM